MVQSKMWEVSAGFKQMAFGTPMFSQRPDAGYLLAHPARQSAILWTSTTPYDVSH
jgi:hypothetical protein